MERENEMGGAVAPTTDERLEVGNEDRALFEAGVRRALGELGVRLSRGGQEQIVRKTLEYTSYLPPSVRRRRADELSREVVYQMLDVPGVVLAKITV